ncbi:MAG: TIGR04255 family protein, partial [Pseudomonadota bacterium]|nr:TIGR04255 family protein [Pseudomonadota bacterium]
MIAVNNRRKYRNPPIEEAIVEFHFRPGQEWDLTIPGKLHQHPAIKDQYPGKPRTHKIMEASFQAGPEQPATWAVREGPMRTQLVDTSGHRLISVGPDMLSVNVLRPYDDWEQFRPRIDAALQAYAEVAKPNGVWRVGVRYINKIVVTGKAFDIPKYFTCGPPFAPGLPGQMAGFISRVEYLYDDAIKLLLT